MWFTQIYPAKGDILVVGMTDHPIKPSIEQLLGLEMLHVAVSLSAPHLLAPLDEKWRRDCST